MTGWLLPYLQARYEDGARGPDRFDCWGLVREVRHKYCGCALLPAWGHVRNTMPREFTRAYHAVAAGMVEGPPAHGSVAAVFRGLLCIHVGVVLDCGDGLRVLDINQRTGAKLQRLADFERAFLKVRYYADPRLPVET